MEPEGLHFYKFPGDANGADPDREKRVPEGQIGKLRLKGKYLEDCRKSVNAVERQD